MKKIKRLIMLILIASIVSASLIGVSAQENAAVLNSVGTNHSGKLVDSVSYIVDDEGNCEEIGEATPLEVWGDDVLVQFDFYDMGTKEGSHHYEVQMEAKCLEADNYFTKSILYAKPKNNKSWFKSPLVHAAYLKKTTIDDSIYYSYPGDGPSNPTVKVKASISINSYSFSVPETTLSSPQ